MSEKIWPQLKQILASFPLRIFGTRLVFKVLSLQQKVTVTNLSFDTEDVVEINFCDFDFGYRLGLLFCH